MTSFRRACSSTFQILDTASAVDESFVSFDSLENDRIAGEDGAGPSYHFLLALLIFGLYFDSSVALWQNVYKDDQLARDGPNCVAVHDWVLQNQHGFGKEPVALKAAEGCPASITKELSETHEEASLLFRRLSGPKKGEADVFERGDRLCSWRAVVHAPTGRLKCKPQGFTKGCALSFQATCGLVGYYCYNYWVGGLDLLKECFNPMRLLKFSAVGVMFGCAAVFSFLAQDALSPGSYALYAQSGVVIVPILWRLTFRKPLPVLTWINIGIITIGIAAYRISEMELDHMFDGIGLLWVTLKVLMAGLASVVAELLLKKDTTLPFTVQVACILPSKALACLLTIWFLPGPNMEWPNHLPDRPGGFFHDWTWLTFVIVFHNLGDTIMSAALAKHFDSVVKAICGVVGIIFPTWVVSYLLQWEDLNPRSATGQLKLTGGIVVVVGSFAYVLGRSQSEKLEKLQAQAAKLKQQHRTMVELT